MKNPDRHQASFGSLRTRAHTLIEKINRDPELEQADALHIIAALDLASAAVDLAFALSTGRKAYANEKRQKLDHFINKIAQKQETPHQ